MDGGNAELADYTEKGCELVWGTGHLPEKHAALHETRVPPSPPPKTETQMLHCPQSPNLQIPKSSNPTRQEPNVDVRMTSRTIRVQSSPWYYNHAKKAPILASIQNSSC